MEMELHRLLAFPFSEGTASSGLARKERTTWDYLGRSPINLAWSEILLSIGLGHREELHLISAR